MIFHHLPPTSQDPLLEALSVFRADTNAQKVDLGVGVYNDDNGRSPVLACVKTAEEWLIKHQSTKAYLSPAGDPGFNALMRDLLLGADSRVARDERVCAVQTVGGSGALRLAAELVKRGKADAQVWLPNPTWANHGPIMGAAGLPTKIYPYYDRATHHLDAGAMLAGLEEAASGDIVVLHGCCHNPSGADLTGEQWRQVGQLLARKGAVPLVDMAYQGFAADVEADAAGLRHLAETLPEVLVTASCSKNFGLYRDRVGALCVIAADKEQAATISRHLLGISRTAYSMPPDHGAAVVAHILGVPALKSAWLNELGAMRDRIKAMRRAFADRLQDGKTNRFEYLRSQNGMFSFLDISPADVERLRKDYHIYAVSTGRINLAGLTSGNVDYVADALATVLKFKS